MRYTRTGHWATGLTTDGIDAFNPLHHCASVVMDRRMRAIWKLNRGEVYILLLLQYHDDIGQAFNPTVINEYLNHRLYSRGFVMTCLSLVNRGYAFRKDKTLNITLTGLGRECVQEAQEIYKQVLKDLIQERDTRNAKYQYYIQRKEAGLIKPKRVRKK